MYDFVMVGGGIVGVSTAMQLLQAKPGCSLLLLEKEDRAGQHQTGHNSGVIHAGVYYEPGSLKARFCKEGATDTFRFCQENGIAFDRCGKLIVATDESELGSLNALADRCKENSIEIERFDTAELKRREPHVRVLAGFLVPATELRIISTFARPCRKRSRWPAEKIRFNTRVVDIRENSNPSKL